MPQKYDMVTIYPFITQIIFKHNINNESNTDKNG